MNAKLAELTREAWRRYRDEGDEETLVSLISREPALRMAPKVRYPWLHRICDILLAGKPIRVLRVLDRDGERLYFDEIDCPDYERHGVPDWLTGLALRAWVELENVCPLKDEYDWKKFRPRG